MSPKNSKIKEQTSLPAYRRIAESIENDIQAGRLKSGDPVPSERELASEFEVSLMTARHALQQLSVEGVLRRVPNVGSFVAPPRIQFNRLVSFTEEIIGRGSRPRSHVLSHEIIEGNDEICARLAMNASNALVRIQRLRISDDDPFSVETCYLPASRFDGIAKEDMGAKSLFDILANTYDIRISYADEEVDATSADRKTAEVLGVPSGTPLLRIRQILFAGGAPIVYSIALYRADRHAVLIRRYR